MDIEHIDWSRVRRVISSFEARYMRNKELARRREVAHSKVRILVAEIERLEADWRGSSYRDDIAKEIEEKRAEAIRFSEALQYATQSIKDLQANGQSVHTLYDRTKELVLALPKAKIPYDIRSEFEGEI